MTTGESANGRSTMAFTIVLPRKRWRARTTARATPKTVFTGTATSASASVSQSAWRASGAVTAAQKTPSPSPKARRNTIATGTTSSSARYPSATVRSASLEALLGEFTRIDRSLPTDARAEPARPEARAGKRRLVFMPRPPPADAVQREQGDEREGEQHDGYGRRGPRRIALDEPEDVHRRHLRLERDVAGDENDRAEL